MANQTNTLKARQEAEKEIISIMEELDKDKNGFNVQYWKNKLKKMSNAQFHDFMQALATDINTNLYFQLNTLNKGAKDPEIEEVLEYAKKRKIEMEEYIIMPDENRDNPDMPAVTKNKQLVFIVPVRKHQQMKEKKNKMSSNSSKINPMTGQVTNESKAARFSDNEMFSLNATNQTNTIKEFLGPRGDDPVAFSQMLKQISTYGRFSLKDLKTKTTNKQSIRTMMVFMDAAGLEARFQ